MLFFYIQSEFRIKKGTRSFNLIAEYELESDEFKPFLIYDTPEFLNVIMFSFSQSRNFRR